MGQVSEKGFANEGKVRYNDQEGLLSGVARTDASGKALTFACNANGLCPLQRSGCLGISVTSYTVFECFHFFRASPKSEWHIPLILGETRVAEGKLTIFPANNEKRRCET